MRNRVRRGGLSLASALQQCQCNFIKQSPTLRRAGPSFFSTKISEATSTSLEESLPPQLSRPLQEELSDAGFEVLGAPYSLLSVSLSASQNLYTRRGTLVAATGKLENVLSTLSILEPFRRTPLGIPFLYQKIISTTPVTALISTKSLITSFATVHLDGTVDWMVCQRKALLAWTGSTLATRPVINRRMGLAHWGNIQITGRGLFALTGTGNVYKIDVAEGQEYIAHPSNVVAYSMNQEQPSPYRLKSSIFRLQVPTIGWSRLLPDSRFVRTMGQSDFWKTFTNLLFSFRMWARRTIWGDRLFLRFAGPTTILLQTRASRISDVLTTRDIQEFADSSAGAIQTSLDPKAHGAADKGAKPVIGNAPRLNLASMGPDGKVSFKEIDSFQTLSR